MSKARVLLADDHSLVLEGFRRILDDQCELVGMVEDGRALLEAVDRVHPDIVILDVSMPLHNSRRLTPRSKLFLSRCMLMPTMSDRRSRPAPRAIC